MTPARHSLRLTTDFLLDYELRISKRSRYLRMRISKQGLVVNQPWGVNLSAVETWLLSKSAWIIQHWPAVDLEPTTDLTLPTQIELQALKQTLQVQYQAADLPKLRLQFNADQQTILIKGQLDALDAGQSLLHIWLRKYAQQHLPILLAQLAQETGLSYQRCSIKTQQTRWGSCSSQGIINLNAKLLFLPPEWVRYVLIHELCHTQELNHSARFWALVSHFEPNYPAIHRAMRDAMSLLPTWVNR